MQINIDYQDLKERSSYIKFYYIFAGMAISGKFLAGLFQLTTEAENTKP